MNYKISDTSGLLVSYQNLSQSILNINLGNYGYPNDLWLGSTDTIRPSTAVQYDIQYKIDRPFLYFEKDAFYKEMKNLPLYVGVFNFKGLGSMTVNALTNYDIPVILACVIFISIVFIITNILVDYIIRF